MVGPSGDPQRRLVERLGAPCGPGRDPSRRPPARGAARPDPLGARALLGTPAAELAGRLLTLEDVAPSLRHLPERLADAPAERWSAIVQRALASAAGRRDAPRQRPELARALALLTRGVQVQEVSAEVGYTRRHLVTLVRAETGLAPKQLQRLARFERSRSLVGRRPLAEVAATCGYADQAHLAREWTRLAGCPPSTWLREEFPFVQDLGDAEG